MHVVQVLASLNPGGSEPVAAELAASSVSTRRHHSLIAAGAPLDGRLLGCGAALLERPARRLRLSTTRCAGLLRDGLQTGRAVYRFLLHLSPG